jgi:hypothetical protein
LFSKKVRPLIVTFGAETMRPAPFSISDCVLELTEDDVSDAEGFVPQLTPSMVTGVVMSMSSSAP